MKKKLIILLTALVCMSACAFGLAACNETDKPSGDTHAQHSWSQAWESDDTHHWHNCTIAGCPITDNSQKSGYGEHDFSKGNCICGKERMTAGLAYSLNSGNASYSVTGIGTATDAEIIIPSVYEGKPVTGIGDSAFEYCRGITSVTIPESVTEIGYHAFYRCIELTNITIPNSVSSIGSNAFDRCGSLQYNEYDNAYYLGNDTNKYVLLIEAKNTSIISCTINENTKFISDFAYADCSNLTNISIPNSVISIGERVFNGCNSLQYNEYDNAYYLGNDTNKYIVLIEAKNTSITSCAINENTKFIYENAFGDCGELTSITIPNGVTTIGDSAFWYCRGLTSITIPNSVTSIEDSAFGYCSSLTSITIPDSVTRIDDSVCRYCSRLTSVTIPDGVTSIGVYAFAGCSRLSSIIIPNSVTSIESSAFYQCGILASVTIPDGITNFGFQVFRDCGNLQYNEYDNAYYLGNDTNKYVVLIKAKNSSVTSCTVHENTRVISDYAFSGCGDLTSVTMPDGVKSIGGNAFYDCSSLTTITLPNSVTYIGGDAFNGCSGLTSITIPNGITSIGDDTFSGCGDLTSITIPDSVTYIGNGAFSGCGDLASMTIPDSVTYIGNGAFGGCSSLRYNEYDNAYYLGNDTNKYMVLIGAKDTSITSCTIHENTKCIYSRAFDSCSGLTSITIPNGVTSIGSYAFVGCSNLTSVILPNSVTNIENYAFYDCSGLTSITIPNGVTSIESYTFRNCNNLANIIFNGTKEQWTVILKGFNWNSNTGNFTVTCTNGQLDKSGNEIVE